MSMCACIRLSDHHTGQHALEGGSWGEEGSLLGILPALHLALVEARHIAPASPGSCGSRSGGRPLYDLYSYVPLHRTVAAHPARHAICRGDAAATEGQMTVSGVQNR